MGAFFRMHITDVLHFLLYVVTLPAVSLALYGRFCQTPGVVIVANDASTATELHRSWTRLRPKILSEIQFDRISLCPGDSTRHPL